MSGHAMLKCPAVNNLPLTPWLRECHFLGMGQFLIARVRVAALNKYDLDIFNIVVRFEPLEGFETFKKQIEKEQDELL